jgi:hypothetical protein
VEHRKEYTELRRRAEEHKLGVGKQRTEIDHRAYTDEKNEGEKLIGDTRIEKRGKRTVLADSAGEGQVDEYGTEAHGQKKRRLHLLADGKIYKHAADYPHNNLLPIEQYDILKQLAEKF